MKYLLCIILLINCLFAYAQENPFPFGQVTYREMQAEPSQKDTSANALVIREYGLSYIESSNDYNLLFTYHIKIKILKKGGLDLADIEIPLRKSGGKSEELKSIQASTFNIENGSLKETKFNSRSVMTEDYNKHWQLKKIVLPNVKVGSVIEYEYVLETPFFAMNFHPWEFQSEIPKLYSEYWAMIPANYRYNISLRGNLKLKKDESSIVKDCFVIGSGKAECVKYKWAMENIPAFVEEDFMTSKKNFISAIRFELIQIEYFDGRKDKVTKEWKDADQELRLNEKFGVQLKRGEDVLDDEIALVIKNELSPLTKAEKIYEFIRHHYRWDEINEMLSKEGIRKAFEAKVGNVGDINLSLVAALRHVGLNCDPMILSTRDNGLPTDLFPVLTEFNYVVARIEIEGKVYFLDATDDFLPFGVLPARCLNGKGRVITKKDSYWQDIKPADKSKQVTMINFQITPQGQVSGSINNTFLGYKGAEKRSKIYSYSSTEAYIKDKQSKWASGEIKQCSLTNVEEISKPLVEKMEVEFEAFDMEHATHFLFNPFIGNTWINNPFKSNERLFPVDFGAPLEETYILNIELPDNLEVTDLPDKVGLLLPNNGGRFIFDTQLLGSKLTITSTLAINRTVFTSQEYHYLKELFSRVVTSRTTDLVLKRKI